MRFHLFLKFFGPLVFVFIILLPSFLRLLIPRVSIKIIKLALFSIFVALLVFV